MPLKRYFTVATIVFTLIANNNIKAQTTVKAPKKVESKKLTYPNPTSRIFYIPLDKLHHKIFSLFDGMPQMYNPTLMRIFYFSFPKDDPKTMQALFSAQTSTNPGFGDEYFKIPGTKNDIFLYHMGNYWNSTMYYHDSEAFEFTSSYAIQLKKLTKNKTLVTVEAIGPEIINGTLCCSPHGNYSRTEKVEPTTVEEYTLILFVAEKLGIKNLKPLQLPK